MIFEWNKGLKNYSNGQKSAETHKNLQISSFSFTVHSSVSLQYAPAAGTLFFLNAIHNMNLAFVNC